MSLYTQSLDLKRMTKTHPFSDQENTKLPGLSIEMDHFDIKLHDIMAKSIMQSYKNYYNCSL